MAYLYPVPPTTNNLDPSQRRQLLKSTQKLGALLGATPRVLESGSTLPPPPTSNSKTFRREGKVFYTHSASSSQTSLDSREAENDIWAPCPPENLMRYYKTTSSPISIEFSHLTQGAKSALGSAYKKSKSKPSHKPTKSAPQQLSQPLLYRMRSRPIPPTRYMSPVPKADAPPSPTTAVENSERRRKMAKLMRTLGETIPPELVFGNPPPRTTSLVPHHATTTTVSISTTASRTPSHRRRSESGARNGLPIVPVSSSAKKTGSSSGTIFKNNGLLSEALKPSSLQLPLITVTTTSSISSTIPDTTTTTTTATTKPKPKRRPRPRSITLAMSPSRGIIIEQVYDDNQSPSSPNSKPIGHQTTRSLDDTIRGSVGRSKNTLTSAETDAETEYGYRKEREWSGEWNVRDMDKVVNGLRGLRLR